MKLSNIIINEVKYSSSFHIDIQCFNKISRNVLDIAIFTTLSCLSQSGIGFHLNMICDLLNIDQHEVEQSVERLAALGLISIKRN